MNMIFTTSFLCVAVSVSGCESKTPASTGVIPAAQTQALKDAKNVEKELLDADQARRKQLDETNQ